MDFTLKLAILLMLVLPCSAQVSPAAVSVGRPVLSVNNGGQSTLSNWGNCVDTPCAGGAGNTTGVTQTLSIVSPSVSGASQALAATFPASGNNVLYHWIPSTCDKCTWVVFDTWAYVPPGIANYEFDSFIFDLTDGSDFMFGKQCNTTTGFWQYANQSSGWTDGPIPCVLTTNSWHHFVFNDYYIPGDTACGALPCQRYGTLSIDGVVSSWGGANISATTLTVGWTAGIGCQFQMDSSASGTRTEYIDLVSCQGGK